MSVIRYIQSVQQDEKANYVFDKLSDLVAATDTTNHATALISDDNSFTTSLITATSQIFSNAFEDADVITKTEVRVFWKLQKGTEKLGSANIGDTKLYVGGAEWFPSFSQNTKYNLETEEEDYVLESLFIFDSDNGPSTALLREAEDSGRFMKFDFDFYAKDEDQFIKNTSIYVYYVEYTIYLNDLESQMVVRYNKDEISSERTISLGSIRRNTSSAFDISLENTGSNKLTLERISATTVTLQNNPTSSGNYSIDVGQTYVLVFSIPTSTVGNFRSEISIQSDDPGNERFRFYVTYSIEETAVASPILTVLQNSSAITNGKVLTIPAVVVSSSSTVDITIKNTGTTNLAISGASISGDGTVSGLSTFGNNISIAPSETKILKLVLNTSTEGNKIISYAINSNDSSHNPFTFRISYMVSKAHDIKLRNNDSSIKPSEAILENGSTVSVGLINDSYTKSYTIQNDGIATDIIVNSVTATGSLVVSSTPSMPFTLRASAANSLTFLITFKTESSGDKTGDIVIDWSAAS